MLCRNVVRRERVVRAGVKGGRMWDETEDPGPKSVIQKAYNQGRVDERNRIVERLKDNLNPSVYDTVIRIIHAA